MPLAERLADLGTAWFEEPRPADDVGAQAALAAKSRVPVAVGESLYSLGQFEDCAVQGAIQVCQVDAARIGGIAPWLKTAHLAEAHTLPVAPHFLMELHASLACAAAAAHAAPGAACEVS